MIIFHYFVEYITDKDVFRIGMGIAFIVHKEY